MTTHKQIADEAYSLIQGNFKHLTFQDRHEAVLKVAEIIRKEAEMWLEVYEDKLKENWTLDSNED